MTSALQQVIDAAWEERDGLGAGDQGRGPRRGRGGDRACSIPARRGSPRRAPDGWTVNQWLKKAVLLSFRLNPMEAIAGGPGGALLVGQGAVQVRRLGARASSARAGFRAVPGRDRPPRRLHRPRTRC